MELRCFCIRRVKCKLIFMHLLKLSILILHDLFLNDTESVTYRVVCASYYFFSLSAFQMISSRINVLKYFPYCFTKAEVWSILQIHNSLNSYSTISSQGPSIQFLKYHFFCEQNMKFLTSIHCQNAQVILIKYLMSELKTWVIFGFIILPFVKCLLIYYLAAFLLFLWHFEFTPVWCLYILKANCVWSYH